MNLVGPIEKEKSNWFSSNISCKLSNGLSLDFWKNKWLGPAAIGNMFPLILARGVQPNHKVADMREVEDNRWIWEVKINDNSMLYEEEGVDLDSLLTMLQKVHVKPFEEDEFVWWRNKLGFSVKSCYQVLESIFDYDMQVDENIIQLLDKLWFTNTPSNILIFSWRLLH